MSDFLPHAERAEVIRHYGQEYGIKHFVETGTNTGDTVEILINDFERITTIEIDPKLTEFARERFEGHSQINCVCADSGEFLTGFVPYLTEPVIYWLDGHFCGGEVRGEIDTPIRVELTAALKSPEGSVILIDDARLFEGMQDHTEEYQDYPPVEWIEQEALRAGFIFQIEDDIMRLIPHV